MAVTSKPWVTDTIPPRTCWMNSMARNKQLPKNHKSVLPLIPLKEMSNGLVDGIFDTIPDYGPTEFRRLVENTVGAIHQIPFFFRAKTGREYQLKQIEAYFGRSSAGSSIVSSNVCGRLRAGYENRRHEYGLIFGRTSLEASLRYEKHGIMLLQALKDNDGLCISNNSFHAGGKVGSTGPGLLYMTFRLLTKEPEPASMLSMAEIKRIVRQRKIEVETQSTEWDIGPAPIFESLQAGLEAANDVRHFGAKKIIDFSQY